MKKTAVLTVAAFAAGWYLSDLQHDRQALAITRAAERQQKATQALASQSARQLEEKRDALHIQQTRYQPAIQHEVNKPIFTAVCTSDEYIRLFNQRSTDAERTLSGESINAVSNPVTPFKR